MRPERDVWIFLNYLPQLGPIRFHRLLELAGSAQAILTLPPPALTQADVSLELAQVWHQAFHQKTHWEHLDQELRSIAEGRFNVVTELDEDYPSALRHIEGRPYVLYYQGRWPIPLKPTIGIVGTRRPTPYGIAVADRLTHQLVQRGMVTVSGLASGIDTCVHTTTLENNGFTVAVMGNGLGHTYPRHNARLQKEIAERGVLLSEFPYNTEPNATHFPRRNRIISGLSQGIVVVEAGEKSGALITARFAAEQGRDVFAVPGSVFHGTSIGCHRLIKEGAKLIHTVEDIWDEWGEPEIQIPPAAPAELTLEIKVPEGLSELETQIFDVLKGGPLDIETMVLKTDRPLPQLMDQLLSLELKGVVRRLPGSLYVTQSR